MASLRQFGDETYREKLASGSEAADALFDEADVIVRKYKDVLGEKAEYYEDRGAALRGEAARGGRAGWYSCAQRLLRRCASA